MTPTSRTQLEAQLNDFDPAIRKNALASLQDLAASGDITLPAFGDRVNLHCHTFFSYNGYGYSPTAIAWHARSQGLAMAGCIDFDVLDAADEFLEACGTLGLRACAGLETRIFVPSFATREINSPGEPGIAYFIGVGFTTSTSQNAALLDLKATAQERNQGVMERVNVHLAPVTLDYARDVLPLTPQGNATERHLCMAYDNKARELMPDADERTSFWADKLGSDAGVIAPILDDAPTLQGMIRAKTMKAGGVGYVKAEASSFPTLEQVSEAILEMAACRPMAGSTD